MTLVATATRGEIREDHAQRVPVRERAESIFWSPAGAFRVARAPGSTRLLFAEARGLDGSDRAQHVRVIFNRDARSTE